MSGEGTPLGPVGERALDGLRALLYRERAELEAELGAPVAFVDTDPGSGPRWLIGPAACNPSIARYRRPDQGQIGVWFDPARPFDRHGHCIEGAGIPIDDYVNNDRFSPDAADHVLLAADRTW